MTKVVGHIYKFGPFRLETRDNRLSGLYRDENNEEVRLSPKEAQVILFLIEHRSESHNAEKLLDKCWPKDAEIEENNATRTISSLRKALGEKVGENKYIQTAGGSYRFVAEITAAEIFDESNKPEDMIPAGPETPEPADRAAENADRLPGGGGEASIIQPVSEKLFVGIPDQAANAGNAAKDNLAAKEGLKTFENWLAGPGRTIKWVLAVCVALCFIVPLMLTFSFTGSVNPEELNPGEMPHGLANWSKPVAALMQCITILIALIYAWKKYRPKDFPSSGNEKIDRKVKHSLKWITNYWLWLLLSWIPLYLFLFVYFGVESLHLSKILSVSPAQFTFAANLLATFFNYLNTIAIVYCFTLLNEEGEDEEENSNYKYLILPAIFLGLTLLGHAIFREIRGVSNVLDLFTGIVAGIAMALFVGRLQSKFLGPRPWLLIFLYSYTALQPLYFYLTINEVWDIWIVLLINIYLVLKCLLYLYMAWIFESTRLSFYLVEIREKHKDIERNWENWLNKLERPD